MVNLGKKGKVVRKSGTGKLYFDFNINGQRFEKSSGLDATGANVLKARNELDDIMSSVGKGTFDFAARFPGSSRPLKSHPTQVETKRLTAPEPHQVLFRDYVLGTGSSCGKGGWLPTRLPLIGTENVRYEYERDIRYWLLKLYGDKSFGEITGDEMHASLQLMVRRDGSPLSGKRVRNILSPFKRIWQSARSQYGWDRLPDPVQYLVALKYLPKNTKKRVPVFRMHEWGAVLARLDPYHGRIVQVMLLTGMINSEVAGLRKQDVELGDLAGGEPGWVHIQYKKTLRGEESEILKTAYRSRDFPISKKLHALLEACLRESPDAFVFTKQDGSPYSYETLRYAWRRAFAKAGMPNRRLYSLRHTFAAWSVTIGLDINKLEALMGHGSKEMIYTRYGKYVQGLERDKALIMDYFGEDFLG